MDYTNASNAVVVHGENGYADCKPGVAGTFINAHALNGLQSEIINAIVKSGQEPIAFDENDPSSYDQLWKAIPASIFLKDINGDSDGGNVAANPSRQFILGMNNGVQWTLQLPSESAQTPGVQYLNNPVDILNVSQAKGSGNFDTGNVNLNLNAISGVTVPSGATGVILQTATSVSGNNDRIGQANSATAGFAWIQAGGSLSAVNFSSAGQVSNLVSYVDTDLGGSDNDNTSYPLVRLNGTNLPYRARVYWGSDFTGTDAGFLRIRLVGFTL
ncbi:MAG: hypothetical protein ACI9SP_004575 [Arenicella sp.]